jgi:hypothetical protein
VRVVVRGKAFWDLVETGIETLQQRGNGRFAPRRSSQTDRRTTLAALASRVLAPPAG